ncbi:MAG: hypothetical protein ACYC2Z_00375, partial [Candidatus Nanopelagicales bacterium]
MDVSATRYIRPSNVPRGTLPDPLRFDGPFHFGSSGTFLPVEGCIAMTKQVRFDDVSLVYPGGHSAA